MRTPAVWYDTCPVCEGRGTIPCSACSGIGHVDDYGHDEGGMLRPHEAAEGTPHQQIPVAHICTCPGCACSGCQGKGAVSCTACHGHGMRGLPAFAGTYY